MTADVDIIRQSPLPNSSNSNEDAANHSESSKGSKENHLQSSFEQKKSAPSPSDDPKAKNRLAQKRFRDRSKQKFDILEETVSAMSKRLDELEQRKAKLQTQINLMQTQQSLRKHTDRILLPQIEMVEPDFVPAVSWAGFNPAGRGGLVLQAVFDQPRRLTREQANKLSVQDVRDFHEEFLVRSGHLLVQNPNEDRQSPAGLKLKELVAERNGFCCYMAFWLPMIFLRLNDPAEARNKDAVLASPDYERLIGSLRLNSQQKKQLRDATREFTTKSHNLSLQREQLKDEILSIPVEEQGVKKLQSLRFGYAVRKLRDNVDHMHIEQCVFWGKIFSAPEQMNYFQEARLFLEAWPFIPDPCHLYFELERQLTGKAMTLQELPTELPVIKQEEELQDEETPYVEVTDKLMSEFSKMGIWGHLGGAEISPAVLKSQAL